MFPEHAPEPQHASASLGDRSDPISRLRSADAGPACEGDPQDGPVAVEVQRTLGHGRAAIAQLVDARFADGSVVRCVEKVFSPGLLTRTIYAAAFWAPFGYTTNSHAIQASFYRRRVAAAILRAAGQPVEVAMPRYVRYDQDRHAWVLAADYIQGRGIIPAPSRANVQTLEGSRPEIDELVDRMRQCSQALVAAGLIGSGWQIDPRAMVSTANLLRTGDRYTIVDLESGIPAVLVPQYVWDGMKRGSAIPFDDCDPVRLRSWFDDHQFQLRGKLSGAEFERLPKDIDALIDHAQRWKASEIAPFRRPWQWITQKRLANYRDACRERWHREGTLDQDNASPVREHLVWWATRVPGRLGRSLARWLVDGGVRDRAKRFCLDRTFRAEVLQRSADRHREQLAAAGRIGPKSCPSRMSVAVHRLVAKGLPVAWHRAAVDPVVRRDRFRQAALLTLSSRYQRHVGLKHIHGAITRWKSQSRIDDAEAERLHGEADGDSVRAYARGFGMHLAVKTLTPMIAPAKVGGIAMFVSTGQLWFLLPVLMLPLVRTVVTLLSMASMRGRGIPHAEALCVGWLPTLGSLAYPIQMYAAQPELSTFLIRDAASRAGCRIPIYGGGDSRTELAAISASDYVVRSLGWASQLLSGGLDRFLRLDRSNGPVSRSSGNTMTYRLPRTGWGRRIDALAIEQIRAEPSGDSRAAKFPDNGRSQATLSTKGRVA